MELLTGISSPAKPAAARDASGTVDQPLALEAVQDAHSVRYAVPGAIGHPWFSQYRPLPFLTRAEAMRRRKVLLSLQPHGESSRRLRAGLAPTLPPRSTAEQTYGSTRHRMRPPDMLFRPFGAVCNFYVVVFLHFNRRFSGEEKAGRRATHTWPPVLLFTPTP